MRTLICGMIVASATIANAAPKPKKTDVTAVYAYADIADLALASEQTVHVKIRRAKALSKKLAPGLPQGTSRQMVTADVISLLRGKAAIAPRISYLIDLKADSRGRFESLTGREMFAFSRPVSAHQVQLVRPDAQLPWSAQADVLLRTILAEATAPGAPPAIRSISAAFRTEGALPGEGESQIFLESADDRPVSISVVRSISAPVNWFVSVGDLVAEGRTPPKRNTLLWYRLACFLPDVLPAEFTDAKEAGDAAALAADYGVVKESLGPCVRKRPAVGG